MHPSGKGRRFRADPNPQALYRTAFRCVLISTLIALAGCETLPTPRLSAAKTPEDNAALALRADRDYQRDDWAAAEAGYQRMTELAPDNAEHWFRLGNIYLHTNRIGDAVRMYGKALERDEAHLGAWHNLGMAQMQLAARSFAELQAKSPTGDPAANRARRIIEGVTELLATEQAGNQESKP